MAYQQRTMNNANAVWDALVEAGRVGASTAELAEDTDLSYMQVRKALEAIRDVFQEEYEQPIVCIKIGRSWRYYLAQYWVDEELPYLTWTFKGDLTHARRLVHHLVAAEAKFPELAEDIARIRRNQERIVEDLGYVMHRVEDVDGVPS